MSRLARKTPTKWYEVGIELEIEPATLDAFEEQTRDQTRLYTSRCSSSGEGTIKYRTPGLPSLML